MQYQEGSDSRFPQRQTEIDCAETCGTNDVTHSTALCVVGPVGHDEGPGLEWTYTVQRAKGRVPAAGQDHKEMCRDGSLVPAEMRDHT